MLKRNPVLQTLFLLLSLLSTALGQEGSLPAYQRLTLVHKAGAPPRHCSGTYNLMPHRWRNRDTYAHVENPDLYIVFLENVKILWEQVPSSRWACVSREAIDNPSRFLENLDGGWFSFTSGPNLLNGWYSFDVVLPHDSIFVALKPGAAGQAADTDQLAGAYYLSLDVVYDGVPAYVNRENEHSIFWQADLGRWEMVHTAHLLSAIEQDKRTGYFVRHTDIDLLGRGWREFDVIVAPPVERLNLKLKPGASDSRGVIGRYELTRDTFNGYPVYKHANGAHIIAWDEQTKRWQLADGSVSLPASGTFAGYGDGLSSLSLFSGWSMLDVRPTRQITPHANGRFTSLQDFTRGRQFRITPHRHNRASLHAAWQDWDTTVAQNPGDSDWDWAGQLWEIYPDGVGSFVVRNVATGRFLTADTASSDIGTLPAPREVGSVWGLATAEYVEGMPTTWRLRPTGTPFDGKYLHAGGALWDVSTAGFAASHEGNLWYVELPLTAP